MKVKDLLKVMEKNDNIYIQYIYETFYTNTEQVDIDFLDCEVKMIEAVCENTFRIFLKND